MDWRIEDAETQLGTVIDRVLSEGPQRIWRGEEAVMVITAEEFQRLNPLPSDFKKSLLEGPSLEGADLERDQSPGVGS